MGAPGSRLTRVERIRVCGLARPCQAAVVTGGIGQYMTATRRLWSDKFRDAARGVRLAVCDGASFRVHFAATVAVVTAGFLCNVSTIEWCVLGLSIGAVLTAETFNSSIEELARAITTEHNKHVGRGLDMAAGAVLLASVAAVIVGLIVFVPRLFSLTS